MAFWQPWKLKSSVKGTATSAGSSASYPSPAQPAYPNLHWRHHSAVTVFFFTQIIWVLHSLLRQPASTDWLMRAAVASIWQKLDSVHHLLLQRLLDRCQMAMLFCHNCLMLDLKQWLGDGRQDFSLLRLSLHLCYHLCFSVHSSLIFFIFFFQFYTHPAWTKIMLLYRLEPIYARSSVEPYELSPLFLMSPPFPWTERTPHLFCPLSSSS